MTAALDTITDYINDGRTLIQDTLQPYRYLDPEMVTSMNVALLEGRRIRPDLFVYRKAPPNQQGSVQFFQANDGTKLIMEEQFRLAFLYGMCAQTLLRDDEDIDTERVTMFLKAFNSILVGSAPQAPGATG